MKLLTGVCALLFGLALIGCGGQQGEQAATHGDTQSAATESAPAADTETPAAEASAPVTLTGTVGCGHCNFGKTSSCSAAIQTAAGDVYVIDGVEHDSELWKLREENAKACEVTGTVAKGDDGLMHLNLGSYKIL